MAGGDEDAVVVDEGSTFVKKKNSGSAVSQLDPPAVKSRRRHPSYWDVPDHCDHVVVE